MVNKIQTKDIPDDSLVELIKSLSGAPVAYVTNDNTIEIITSKGVMLTDICNLWSSVPPKIILSKLNTLIKRGLIDGCTCGCRGDFEVVEKSKIEIMIITRKTKVCGCN